MDAKFRRVGARAQGRVVSSLLALLMSLSLCAGAERAVAARSAALAPGVHQVVINNVRLWYRVAGRLAGTPTVYLHGGPGQGSQSFATIAGPALERSLRMIYLDQRGSGRSERPWNDDYSLPGLVEDLEGLRRELGVERLNLIGHSVGSIIAMEYAARYPQHVERMVLAASGPDLLDAFNRMCDRVARTDPPAYARAVAAVAPGSQRRCNMWGEGVFAPGGMQRFVNRNMFPDPRTESMINEADRANGLRNGGELSKALIRQGLLDYRFTQSSKLRMPVLVIAGGRDFQAAIEPQRAFVSRLPNGRLITYEAGGHFMWAEDPERFARDVVGFLAPHR